MKHIRIADTTLCQGQYTFKEKIEIARQLEKLGVDVIELPPITEVRSDTLLVRTMASFVKTATLSVAAGADMESIDRAAAAEHIAAFFRADDGLSGMIAVIIVEPMAGFVVADIVDAANL